MELAHGGSDAEKSGIDQLEGDVHPPQRWSVQRQCDDDVAVVDGSSRRGT